MAVKKNPRWKPGLLVVVYLATLLISSIGPLIVTRTADAAASGFTSSYKFAATFTDASHIKFTATGTAQWPISTGGYDKVDLSQLSGTYTMSSSVDPMGPFSGDQENPGGNSGEQYWFNNNTSACTSGGQSTDIDIVSYQQGGGITLRINPYLTPVSGSVDAGQCQAVQFDSNVGSTNNITVSDPSTGQGGITTLNNNGGNTGTITYGNTTASTVVFYASGNTIKSLDGSYTYTLTQGSTTSYQISGTNDDSCTADIITAPASLASNYFKATLNYHGASGNCGAQNYPIIVEGTSNPSNPGGGGAGAGNGGSGTTCKADANGNCTTSNPDTISCTSGGGFFTQVLNWILCAAINLAWGAANLMDSWIMNELDIDATAIFDGTTNAKSASHGYYLAWNSFRVLATAILVIAGLIMVVSQAIGMEVFDAYTVRKVLPRLLVAVIGISLSWPLMRFVVEFFDTLGLDIREIMYSPFVGIGGTVSAGVGLLSYLGIGATIFIMGPASLTFLLTAMLAAFVGFIVLVVRQIAIVMLVIIAPIAIACYILPNTQKAWKLWYDNFLGLMLMFPIISALIAAGHIFAAVTDQGGPGGGVVAQAVGLMAYFAPYFMIPMAARMATGIIGNIAGFVNDRHKGAFDRLKGARSNSSARNVQRLKAGNRFSDRNAFTRQLNRRSAGIASGWNGRFGMGERGKEAIHLARHNAAVNDVMKNHNWAGIQENDDALRALTYNNAGAAREALSARWRNADGSVDKERVDRAVATAQTSIGFGRPQAIAAAQQLATTGTGFEAHEVIERDAAGTVTRRDSMSAMEDQVETIARAAGGDVSTASSIAGYNNFINKQKGRYDLAPGAGSLIKMSEARMTGGRAARGAQKTDFNDAIISGARSADAVTLLRGKTPQVEALTSALAAKYRREDPTTRVGGETYRQIADLTDALSYASPEAQAAFRKHLGDFGIPGNRPRGDDQIDGPSARV